eukprot:1123973-Pyramimonas_sp.AAC.1
MKRKTAEGRSRTASRREKDTAERFWQLPAFGGPLPGPLDCQASPSRGGSPWETSQTSRMFD